MRVLLTGSAGFIGAAVAEALEARGDEVVRVDVMLPMAHGATGAPDSGTIVAVLPPVVTAGGMPLATSGSICMMVSRSVPRCGRRSMPSMVARAIIVASPSSNR